MKLRFTKRSFEYRMLKQAQLDTLLSQKIREVFLDWNFEEDKSFTVSFWNQIDKKWKMSTTGTSIRCNNVFYKRLTFSKGQIRKRFRLIEEKLFK